MKKAVYHMDVVHEFSYENVLVVELKNGVPENDQLYLLCVQSMLSHKTAADNVRSSVKLIKNAAGRGNIQT